MNEEEKFFKEGIMAFNEKRFYDAHEHWEEIWVNYKLKDAKFIQGLIQVSVSYFHLFNGNLKGARSMIRKSIGKFESFEIVRGIDVLDLVGKIEEVKKHLESIDESFTFEPNTLDVITLWDLIEHLRNPLESLKKIYQIMILSTAIKNLL